MFTVQIETLDPTVMAAFARLFNELASVDRKTESMTGKQYIDKLDSPDVGTDTIIKGTGGGLDAASVFASRIAGIEGQTHTVTVGAQDAATVFAASPNASPQEHAPLAPAAPSTNTTESTPLAAQSGASSSGAAVLLDITGLPWDARIHSGARTQTAKGVWKARKNVADAVVAEVTAQLRAAMNAPAAAPHVPLNAALVAPPPPVTTAAIAPPPPVEGAAPSGFVEIFQYVTGRKFPPETVVKVCEAHGLAGLGLLACRPDLEQAIYQAFAAL